MVPIDQIVGTVGRASDLGTDFRPMVPGGGYRFRCIRTLMQDGAALPPIELYKLDDRYYVVDGHHRVAAARSLGQRFMDAVVTEFQVTTEHGLAAA